MVKLYLSVTTKLLFVFSQVNSVNTDSENNIKCQGTCKTGNSTRFLPFPFGFSPGCPIQLNCSNSTDIIVHFPTKCDRQLDSISVLFGQNYAFSAANNLLLENFSWKRLLQMPPCQISPTFLQRSFKFNPCMGSGNIVLFIGLVAGALLMGGVVLLSCYVRRYCNSSNKQKNAKRRLCEAAGSSSVAFYAYRDIERATEGFYDKHRLGTGAYGTVYAGKLHNDELVAIKRFRYKDPDSIDQVMNEIKLLSSVKHPNHVRLLGCCIEEGEPIMVYEFMPNGTLSQHLHRERGEGLPWTARLTIAAETAKAIAYLHFVNPPIFHRDQ